MPRASLPLTIAAWTSVLLASLAGAASARAQPLLLDEVVAVIDLRATGPRRSILLSEVELSARLERARAQGAGSLDDPLGTGTLAAGLSSLVDRLVVVGEAERLAVFRLDEKGSDSALGIFVERVGRAPFEAWLERSGQSLETVREEVLRTARVRRYLEGRFRLAARPRPSQVVEAWSQQTAGVEPFEQARPRLEAELERQRFDELVSQFVADVRRRVRLRVLRDFAADEIGTPAHGRVRAPQAAGGG